MMAGFAAGTAFLVALLAGNLRSDQALPGGGLAQFLAIDLVARILALLELQLGHAQLLTLALKKRCARRCRFWRGHAELTGLSCIRRAGQARKRALAFCYALVERVGGGARGERTHGQAEPNSKRWFHDVYLVVGSRC